MLPATLMMTFVLVATAPMIIMVYRVLTMCTIFDHLPWLIVAYDPPFSIRPWRSP